MQSALETALHEAFVAAGRQSRHDFLRLRAESDGGWRVETTDTAWLEAAAPRLADAAAGAPLHHVLLPAMELRGRAAWVTASVAEVRREPRHESEQISQALQGETLVPLLHEDGWVLGRLPDGYVGWVRDWHLRLVDATEPAAFAARVTDTVDVPWSVVRGEPDADADPCGETLLGTRVATLRRAAAWCEIELPGGRRGWLPAAALRAGVLPWASAVAPVLATLRRCLGVPYLWGGRSPKGFDCSGLVQFVFGLHGVALPRDSDEQVLCGRAVDAPRAGDLLFFGKERVTHVGVALDAERFLHARGEVRRNALVADRPLHDAELRALWLGTRRILPEGA